MQVNIHFKKKMFFASQECIPDQSPYCRVGSQPTYSLILSYTTTSRQGHGMDTPNQPPKTPCQTHPPWMGTCQGSPNGGGQLQSPTPWREYLLPPAGASTPRDRESRPQLGSQGPDPPCRLHRREGGGKVSGPGQAPNHPAGTPNPGWENTLPGKGNIRHVA